MKLLGYSLVALPFLGLLLTMIKLEGLLGTAIIMAITLAIVLPIIVGCYLINK